MKISKRTHRQIRTPSVLKGCFLMKKNNTPEIIKKASIFQNGMIQ